MRVGKQNATSSKSIDIGRQSLGVPAHAPNPVIEVIDRNKQDMWTLQRVDRIRLRNSEYEGQAKYVNDSQVGSAVEVDLIAIVVDVSMH